MDNPWSDGSDQELVRRAAAGDDRAFECLVLKYRFEVLKIARNRAQNLDEDEYFDVVQEIFFKAWRVIAGQGFRPGGIFQHWLFRLARNEAITARRRKARGDKHIPGRFQQGSSSDPYSIDVAGPEEFSARDVLRREDRDQIELILGKLDSRDRLLLRLTYWEGMTLAEIAREVHLSIGAVCKQLQRARQRFRELWDQLDCSDSP
jgi:RNA polymerase sigma-70 factor (ECF subfamily)